MPETLTRDPGSQGLLGRPRWLLGRPWGLLRRARPHQPLSAAQLQASGLPGSGELTVGAAIACFLALEGADVSYANHRGQSPLDLASEGRVLKALQGCAQRFR